MTSTVSNTGDIVVPEEVAGNVAITSIAKLLDPVYNWSRQNSVWPMVFGLACCAIEMMATGASKYDLERFGCGAFMATPRRDGEQAPNIISSKEVRHLLSGVAAESHGQMQPILQSKSKEIVVGISCFRH